MNHQEFTTHFGYQKPEKFSNHWVVYFLLDGNDEIVYVGKSSSSGLGKRLLSHSKTKEYESYFVLTGPRTEQEVYRLEGAFITWLQPKYNKANTTISAHEIKYLAEWMEGDRCANEMQPRDMNLVVDLRLAQLKFMFYLLATPAMLCLVVSMFSIAFDFGAGFIGNALIAFFVFYMFVFSVHQFFVKAKEVTAITVAIKS